MKATAVSILILVGLTVGGPVGAAPDKSAGDYGKEIAALTEAISAQLKLLEIYEGMDKAAEIEATKKSILTLLSQQQRAITMLRRSLDGEPDVDMKIRFDPRKTPQPGSHTPRPPDGPPAAAPKAVIDVIHRGLTWLAAHQDPKGYWDSDGWMIHDGLGVEAGAGYVLGDPGVTGLATLAFLRSGHTHKSGDYKATVKLALRYLKQIQDPEGCFGPRTSGRFSYNHAICALAMSEAYRLTESPIFKQSAQAATDFIHKMQNPYMAWRYGVRPQDNDTSVTGWMVAALHAAKQAGLRVDDAAFQGAMTWIEKMTDADVGRIGYLARGGSTARAQAMMDKFPPSKSEAMTAAGLVTRVHCGQGRGETYQKGLHLVSSLPPDWNTERGTIDMYYWYWGTMATRQVGGRIWKEWRKPLVGIVRENQRRDGPFVGSFDPVGAWGMEGGRIYSTAMMTLVASMIEIKRWVKENKPVEELDIPTPK